MASPQLQGIIQAFRDRPVNKEQSIEESRAEFEQLLSLFPIPPDVQIQLIDAGGVRSAWVSVPDSVDDKVLYFLHGGGYATGSIKTHSEMVSRICRAGGLRALLIDYRLAPEHPFPAAVEDAIVAYRWLLDTGISPSSIVVAGDSAGGGLTLATLAGLRDRGEPLPAAAVCLSPWTDMEALGESMQTNAASDPLIQREDLSRVGSPLSLRREPSNSAGGAALRRSPRLAAASHSSRRSGGPAGRFDSLCRPGEDSWGRRHPRSLG